MNIQYEIKITLINIITSATSQVSKTFDVDLSVPPASLYNNTHILVPRIRLFNMFENEVRGFMDTQEIQRSSVDIDDFEIVSLTDSVDIYFEDAEDNVVPMSPNIMCYVHSEKPPLAPPRLYGVAYDSTTIIWSWPDDEDYPHYLIDEVTDFTNGVFNEHVITQIPVGQKTYVETGLDPDTPYTRRLVNYTTDQYSFSSDPVTVWTETAEIHRRLSEYNVARNYDFTTPDKERESIDEALKAFRSGIGDNNDLKVYKQMDADFYQKFKAYFEITGRRTVKEKKYAQTGFNYKICLEAQETVDEQEGEVVFDVTAYPREWIVLQDYLFDTGYVKVDCRMKCTIFLRKEDAIIPAASTAHETAWWKPKFHIEDTEIKTEIPGTTQIKSNPLHFIFVLDRTGSLDSFGGISNVQRAVQEAATYINNEVTSQGGAADFSLITFASTASNGGSGIKVQKKTLQEFINALFSSYTRATGTEGDFTNWIAPLSTANTVAKNINGGDPNSVITLFFSDGFPNTLDGTNGITDSNNRYRNSNNCAAIINNINNIVQGVQGLHDNSSRVICATPGTGTDFTIIGHTDGLNYYRNVGGFNGYSPFYGYAYSVKYVETCAQIVATTGDWVHWDKEGIAIVLQSALRNCIQVETTPGSSYTETTRTITFNNEWEVTDVTQTGDLKYNLDSVIAVNLDISLYSILFYSDITKPKGQVNIDHASKVILVNTPVWYNREERRAVIPVQSFINGEIKIGGSLPNNNYTDNIRELILAWTHETSAWKNGYNKTVGTVEQNQQESDKFLVKGLMVENTYGYADDDVISSDSFGMGAYKPGYMGSVNTYATGIYKNSEDIYLIPEADNPNQKLEILLSGYADSIIYDATIYSCYELNAYDTPSVILLTSGAYNSQYYDQMACRKMQNLKYKANCTKFGVAPREPSHVIEVIRWDKDIQLTTQPNISIRKDTAWSGGAFPTGAGHPYYLGLLLTDNIVASIDTYYSSPVLDYRFNLEDPDAKTPLYEIMPTCDPASTFLHIVILKVYYARNVYVTNADNNGFIDTYGTAPLPTKNNQGYVTDPPYSLGSPSLDEGYFKWTTKVYNYNGNRQIAPAPHTSIGAGDNGWYIDNYIWFQSKPHKKDRDYYDEIPGEGMETLYGLVNSRYRKDNQSGKRDLYVDTPQFNIPASVKPGTEKIYIMISEFYPEDAIVSYKWDAGRNNVNLYRDPATGLYKDDITVVNGNNVTFSGNTIKYEDVVYDDLISTINYGGIELFNTKTTEYTYQLQRPEIENMEYEKYFLDVSTDNSDVLALRYPTEILFDETTGEAEFNVAFKGVVNATSKWSPRIHNGYYYLNQHEYFAYSEFDVEANFEEFEEVNFQTLTGYISIEVILKDQTPKPKVVYKVIKDTRSQLLQDEENFTWLNGRGVTLLPTVNSELYKRYEPRYYYSPMLIFDECIDTAHNFIIDYAWYDPDEPEPEPGNNYTIKGYTMPEIEFRYYDMATYEWSDWIPLQYQGSLDTTNIGSAPRYQGIDPNTGEETTIVALSSAYQLRILMNAVTSDSDYSFEDYLCCYLDWKDDQSEDGNLVNISTIADHMTNGPDLTASGTYVSKIFDYGYEASSYQLGYFESFYNNRIELYVASSNDTKDLLIENVIWTKARPALISLRETGLSDPVYGRYFRYKIVIPPGEKLYWLRKVFNTKSTVATVPVLQKISFEGEYSPQNLESTFTNTEAFELIADGDEHKIFDNLKDLIGSDIIRRGFTTKDIYMLNISCTTSNIALVLHPQLQGNGSWVCSANDAPIEGEVKAHTISPVYDKKIDHTPYIFSEPDDFQNESILIHGVPEQFAPITVEDQYGEPYMQLMDGVDFDLNEVDFKVTDAEFFRLNEQFTIDESSVKFIALKTNKFEIETLAVTLNGSAMTEDMYKIQNNIIIFTVELAVGDAVNVFYFIPNTFIAQINRIENTTKILLYSNRREFNQGMYDAEARRITYDKIKDIPLTVEGFVSPVNFKTYAFEYNPVYHFSDLTSGSWTYAPDGNWTYGLLVGRNQEYGFTYEGDNKTYFSVYSTDYPVLEYTFDVNITSSRADDEAIGLFLAETVEFGEKKRLFFFLDLNGRAAGCVEIRENGIIERTNAIQEWELNLPISTVWANNGYLNDTIRVRVEKKKGGIYIRYGNFENNNENLMDIISDVYSWFTKYDRPTDFGMFSLLTRSPQYIINEIKRTEFTETEKKYKIFFETNKVNNKFAANDLSLNPIYRTEYKGFIYLTDEHNNANSINIYCNPTRLVKGGFDRVDISIEVLDEFKNPVIGIPINANCSVGILTADSNKTDMNGVIHYVYESANAEATDTVSFFLVKEDGTKLENSIVITSE